jgi:magnesium transporter
LFFGGEQDWKEPHMSAVYNTDSRPENTSTLPETTGNGLAEIEALKERHPSDIAEILESGKPDPTEIIEVLLKIGNRTSIEAFQQLSIETQRACIEIGNPRTMLLFVQQMEPDDRVDLLKAVDPDIREAMMPLIARAERNEIRRLWDYEEGTAGAVMTTEYASLPENITIGTGLAQLRLQAPSKETIYYIYITDSDRRLKGMISLRDLILSSPQDRLEKVIETNVISVHHRIEVEEVAATISKYDFIAVPVVDDDNRLLGIITVDDVIDIIEAEGTEDFHRISAVVPFEEEYFRRPLGKLFWNRFVWLAILLFTSLLSTSIMEWNAETIRQMVALSFFIPMVIGTCGNAGTQSATMVVRALALGEVMTSDFLRIFRRELLMGAALGLALGVMAYFRVFLQDWNVTLGLIVAGALLATLIAANLAGALLPLLLRKIGLDPALTAGPFIATIIDALGIGIYFKVATMMLRVF